jgi:hypothetical protein
MTSRPAIKLSSAHDSADPRTESERSRVHEADGWPPLESAPGRWPGTWSGAATRAGSPACGPPVKATATWLRRPRTRPLAGQPSSPESGLPGGQECGVRLLASAAVHVPSPAFVSRPGRTGTR